jgi:hypothetical protein
LFSFKTKKKLFTLQKILILNHFLDDSTFKMISLRNCCLLKWLKVLWWSSLHFHSIYLLKSKTLVNNPFTNGNTHSLSFINHKAALSFFWHYLVFFPATIKLLFINPSSYSVNYNVVVSSCGINHRRQMINLGAS